MRPMFLLSIALLLAGCGAPAEEAPIEAPEAEPEAQETMVLIPGGEYAVGSDVRPPNLGAQWYEPEHKVTVDPFYIDVHEVTYEQWLMFDIAEDREYKIEGEWRKYYQTGKESAPVANVTYQDAEAYCEWAGKRLPTEIEWEIAARGVEGFRYPWGNEFDASMANTHEYLEGNTQEVGFVVGDRSPFGVHDLMGNVQEWTTSLLKAYPKSPANSQGDRDTYRMNYRVVRGGSYAIKGKEVGLWLRMGFPEKAQFGSGFRCAKPAEAPAEGDGSGS